MKHNKWNLSSSVITLIVLFLIFASALLFIHWLRPQPKHATIIPLTTPQQPTHSTIAMVDKPKPIHWKKFSVHPGDSLARIFMRAHEPYRSVVAIWHDPAAKHYLAELKPGQSISFYLKPAHQLRALKYSINPDETLYLEKQGTRWTSHLVKKPMTSILQYKTAVIKHSLDEAAHRAELTPSMLAQLKAIFSGSINYSRSVRAGDRFSILYREYYIGDKPYRTGNIVAAEFQNGKHTYRAVRFTYPKHHTGYYKPDGHGVERLFLWAPLKYDRISSYFSYHRMDPYLHVIRPHLGIDYAAPRGTPIKSIGNGRVTYAGKDGGYGNAVIIRYSRKYKALYGHMEHFAKHLRAGEHVKKGQVIGYVGDTGWSTGPHLHFELYVYGVPKNPLKMKFPGGKSVPKSYLNTFHAHAKALLATLEQYQNVK